MHAASVHPEPGSNSRNHCIKTTRISPRRSNLLSSLALSFFYFCFWVVFSFKELFEIRFAHTYMLCTSLLLFNFQRSSLPPLLRRPCYYTTFMGVCQPLFLKFFKNFFQKLVCFLFVVAASRTACILYYFPPTLSSTFFNFFSFFLTFVHLHNFYTSFSTTFRTKSIHFIQCLRLFLQFLCRRFGNSVVREGY